MGCKQSTQIRKHSYISNVKGRPLEHLLNVQLYLDDLPNFVNFFFYQYKYHQLKYVKGEYKDLFFHDNNVYGLELISNSEFNRRIILQEKVQSIDHVVMYNKMFYIHGVAIGVMDRYEIDFFELLKTCQINIDDFVQQICVILKNLHQHGVYIQDLKPENIFVSITSEKFVYHIGDIEYALMDGDFKDPVQKRVWVRTLNYCPNLGKPKTKLEAIRNDYYALAVIVGRLETFYVNETKINVFCEPRKSIFMEGWDDRYKLNDQDLKYSNFCSDFIVEKLFNKKDIKKFLPTLLSMTQQ